MHLVLDTDSFITAIRSVEGAAAEVVRKALNREVVLLMDLKLSLEYRDVAFRDQHLRASAMTRKDIEELISSLEDLAVPVEVVTKLRPLSLDPNDDMILELAFNGRADLIVSKNARHLDKPARTLGIAVLTPKQLLGQLKGR